MDTRDIRQLERILQTEFPTSCIHVRPNVRTDFVISVSSGEPEEVVKYMAEQILSDMGYSEHYWSQTHYGGE